LRQALKASIDVISCNSSGKANPKTSELQISCVQLRYLRYVYARYKKGHVSVDFSK